MELLTRKDALSQGLKQYFTGKPCKHGHVATRFVCNSDCQECRRIKTNDRYHSNPEADIARTRQWAQSNKEKSAEHKKAWAQGNREQVRRSRLNWLNENKDLDREIRRQWKAQKRATSPEYRVLENLRCRLRSVLTRGTKSASTLNLLGCTPEQLTDHLASQFTEGMTWDNYGEWHVDHIRPCASFDLLDPEQQRQCFHFTNLQPLWAVDNLRKGASYDQ